MEKVPARTLVSGEGTMSKAHGKRKESQKGTCKLGACLVGGVVLHPGAKVIHFGLRRRPPGLTG